MQSDQNEHEKQAELRKSDHINLAFESQQVLDQVDNRFYYEPILSSHLTDESLLEVEFVDHTLKLPFWVSSMTGGTEKASVINENLAKACGQFGMGMGLGSCRYLLNNDEYLKDFQVKKYMPDMPLYANLGIAQLEEIARENTWSVVAEMLKKLEVDGLFIHVNPLQEYAQPEGDRFLLSPLETIKHCLDNLDCPLIVKEVGQGMGPKSLQALLGLPLKAIEFASSGGTNFALLELLRSDEMKQNELRGITNIGHTAEQMVGFLNEIKRESPGNILVNDIIISGGVRGFLDNYYLRDKIDFNAVTGHASAFLRYALKGYSELSAYIEEQKKGLLVAHSYLQVK